MNDISRPLFSVGEIAILQPPHPSAKHLWGRETRILRVSYSKGDSGGDAMGGFHSGWNYLTDVPAPPPTDLPEDQHANWVWCEYDLRKRYEAGDSFAAIMAAYSTNSVKV